MIVYYSIFAYTCLISYFGCYLYRRKLANSPQIDDSVYLEKAEKSISLFWALVSISLLVFFVSERSAYNDTAMYIFSFNNASTTLSSEEFFGSVDAESPGFNLLMILFKKYISTDYNAWFTFLAIFQAGAIVLLYYRYSCNYFLSMYLFIASTSFTWMESGVRQFTAVCLILYFITFVIERKLIGFLIVLYIAYTIHDTAILWLPIYFIVRFKPFSTRIWVCIALTVVVFFFITQFTTLLDSSLEGTNYEGYGETIMNYRPNNSGEKDDGVNPIRFLVSAVPPAIALWRWKYIKDRTNPAVDIFINMGTAAAGVNLLGMVTSGVLVGRIPIFFTLVNFITIPWLFKYAFAGRIQKFVVAACYILYFIYFIYDMVYMGMGMYVSDNLGISYWTVDGLFG
jgi:transmembrane protein EpsG